MIIVIIVIFSFRKIRIYAHKIVRPYTDIDDVLHKKNQSLRKLVKTDSEKNEKIERHNRIIIQLDAKIRYPKVELSSTKANCQKPRIVFMSWGRNWTSIIVWMTIHQEPQEKLRRIVATRVFIRRKKALWHVSFVRRDPFTSQAVDQEADYIL